MSLVVLVPMRGRPHTVAPLLESIRATCDARVVFCCTEGDADVIAEVKRFGCNLMLHPPRQIGDYAVKINEGIEITTEDHIFTGACDLRFHPGWYEAAVAKLTDGIGLVGTNDLSPRGDTLPGVKAATHFLATREYARRGTIDGQPGLFFEGYPHEWIDDEAIYTAHKRGTYAYAEDSIVEHLHPLWGKAESDAMYEAAPGRIAEGRRIWSNRRRRWFLRM